jgi:hypothetical protein
MVAMRTESTAIINSLVVVLGSQRNMAMQDIQPNNKDMSQIEKNLILSKCLRNLLSNLVGRYFASVTGCQYHPGIHPLILLFAF